MIYKAISFGNLISPILLILALIAFEIFSLRGIYVIIKERMSLKQNVINYLITALFNVVSLYLITTVSLSMFLQVENCIVPYHNGNYLVVSGEVQDYKDTGKGKTIEYTVDNVHFEYAPTTVPYLGINSSKCVKEHDVVQIKYITLEHESDENTETNNVIMEIENYSKKTK